MELALSIREKRESHIKHIGGGLPDPKKRKINFLDYYQSFLDNYKNKDVRIVRYSLEHFRKFVEQKHITPSSITNELVLDFKRYLQDHLNGETPYNYFTKFKKVCKQATKEHIFFENPAEDISITRPGGVKKEILSFKEIQKLAKTPAGNPELKLAFLFCLNTGLRHIDVNGLKWKHVDPEMNLLKMKQSKVEKSSSNPYVYIELNNNAQSILNQKEMGKQEDNIFSLPSLTSCLKTLKTWTKNAGIKKNITWHSARHSFATNLLMNKADIKTVSGLLGHADLKHTQKYTHLVDELKRKAVDSLPDIDI